MARRLATMGVRGYNPADPMKPTFHEWKIGEPATVKKPLRIGVGFMGDLFDPGFEDHIIERIIDECARLPRHTYLFLTKRPQRLRDFNPWPANCWVGVSATDGPQFIDVIEELQHVRASVRFVSLEPLLHPVGWPQIQIPLEWIIIGGRTRPNFTPPHDWITNISNAACTAGIPTFIKPNAHYPDVIQQFPSVARSEVSNR
jgi:protein gp37